MTHADLMTSEPSDEKKDNVFKKIAYVVAFCNLGEKLTSPFPRSKKAAASVQGGESTRSSESYSC